MGTATDADKGDLVDTTGDMTGDPNTEAVKALAGMKAAAEHDTLPCETFDLEGDSTDGANRLYCGNCGIVLLSWGDA